MIHLIKELLRRRKLHKQYQKASFEASQEMQKQEQKRIAARLRMLDIKVMNEGRRMQRRGPN